MELVITPPFLAGPLRLQPFTALRLTGSRITDPASARAFARPNKDVTRRVTQWQRKGLISTDDLPGLYIHEYTASGMVVRGLVGLLDVSHRAHDSHERTILPHEGIYPAQADDLAARMADHQMNPAPILLAQRSPAPLRQLLATIRQTTPTHDFTDRSGERHRLWAISDPARLTRIGELLAPTSALIADGHHRYAAYLRLQQRSPGGPADYGLAMIVDHDDTPLFLGAIHRLLTGSSVVDVARAADVVGWQHRLTSRAEAVNALGPHRLVATDGDSWLVLDTPAAEKPAVTQLHGALVPALAHGPQRIAYHHSVQSALGRVGAKATAVLVPAATFEQVLRAVRAGHLFPEKATSFQPKPPFGVLLRSLKDGPVAREAPRLPPAKPAQPPT